MLLKLETLISRNKKRQLIVKLNEKDLNGKKELLDEETPSLNVVL